MKWNGTFLVYFAVLADNRVKIKESKNIKKYLDLARELKKLKNILVILIPIVIGALRTKLRGLERGLEQLKIRGRIETIKTMALQRCRCILQPQPTGPLVEGVLSVCRDIVGVFCSLSRLGHSLRASNPSAEMSSVYSAASADWATRWGRLTRLQRYRRCILQPQPTRPLVEEVLPVCRDVVGVFYSPSRLGHSLRESYPSAEISSVYHTASADWATRWGSLTPLQRCSRCILQPQPTGPLVGGVLPLCRDVVGVFYSLSPLGHSLGESYPSAEMSSV